MPQILPDHFAAEIERAVAEAIEWHLNNIITAARNGSEQASRWFLERTQPSHFGRTKLEVTGADGEPLAGAQIAVLVWPHQQNQNHQNEIPDTEKIILPQLHPIQVEVQTSPARHKVIAAGRRWGKGILGVGESVLRASAGQASWWIWEQLVKPPPDCYRPRVTTLLLATRNAHKVDEFRAILGCDFCYLTLNDFPGAPKVIEDAETFAGNAAKKAVELARWLAIEKSGKRKAESGNVFVLADDSGLEVDALDGAPGVHSARFAGIDSSKSENSSDAENNAKLLRLLQNVPPEKRVARFRCVVALVAVPIGKIEVASPVCYADEMESRTFDGICEGKIIFKPRGKNGFGYDPLFMPDGFEKTFAELGDEVKNQLSHRAKALAKLKAYFTTTQSLI